MARQPPWVIFIGLVAYGAAPPRPLMAALDPAVRISQYAHTAWRVRDGFLGSAPHAVGQTTDGYLWIGTDAGLVRFDGVRFVPWAPPRETPLPSSTVLSLLGARDGSLWIGTTGGLAHWTNDRLVRFLDVGGWVNAILEDDDGAIWIARSRITGVGYDEKYTGGTRYPTHHEVAQRAYRLYEARGFVDGHDLEGCLRKRSSCVGRRRRRRLCSHRGH